MRAGVALLALALAGCASAATSSSPPPTTAIASPASPASASPASTATAAPSPTATASTSPATATIAGCPAPLAFAASTPLAREATDVDDVAVTANGQIWVTAVNSGQVLELDGGGALLHTFSDGHGPEGIVPLPGGTFALAEQRSNRVVRFDPATGATTQLVDVPNRTTNEGVDGLAFDVQRSRLIVPDSANGRLLAVQINPDGTAAGSPQVLATGLGRPVAAWAEADGSVDVGVENAPGLVRVGTAGAVTRLVASGALPQVDEVLGEGGLLYITDLTLHTVEAVDPRTGRLAELITDAADPQGLALMGDGRFLLVESVSRELVVVRPCT